jgi:hypothetical protein
LMQKVQHDVWPHHINFYFNSKFKKFLSLHYSHFYNYLSFCFSNILSSFFSFSLFCSLHFFIYQHFIFIVFSSHFAERRTKVKWNLYLLWQRYEHDDYQTHFFSSNIIFIIFVLHNIIFVMQCKKYSKKEKLL